MKKFGLSQSWTAKAALILTFGLALVSNANAKAVLDTFGTNGVATVNMGSNAWVTGVVIQPDGKIVVAGTVQGSGTTRDIALARFNANGTLDTTFGTGGKVVSAISTRNEIIYDVALQPDGKIVVAGNTNPFEAIPVTDFLLVRYNSNGSLDTSFVNSGVVTVNQSDSDVFLGVVVQPDGKIVAVGGHIENDGEVAVFRFNPNGGLDSGFGGGFIYFNFPGTKGEIAHEVLLLPNGRILIGGVFRTEPPMQPASSSNFLVLLERNGDTALDFGQQSRVFFGNSHFGQNFDMALTPDNKILTIGVGGVFRFLSNGTTDMSLQSSTSIGENIAVRPDNSFVTAFTHTSPPTEARIFDRTGKFVGQDRDLSAGDIAVQPDDKMIFANANGSDFVVKRVKGFTSFGTRTADFDGDERTDFGVVRPSNNTFYLLRSNGTVFSLRPQQQIGTVIPEDYRGIFSSDFVFWSAPSQPNSPANFYYNISSAGNSSTFQWGVAGDIPVGGDYNGDRRTDYTVFRPSNGVWYIWESTNNQLRAIQFGQNGDRPVPADYDYDGITDIAVFRPANGTWYVRRSSDSGLMIVQWGISTDIPLTGDFDGDGRADFVVFRPSTATWHLLNSTDGYRAVQWGISTDSPVPGDYDGDGRHDIAVFRDGIWYLLQSRDGFRAVQWGAAGDIPVAIRY